MVTIKDVARIAGVSTATVSRVVHNGGQVGDECRAHVKKVIKDLGYRPNTNARALVSKRSNVVGVIMPALWVTFFSRLTSGAEHAARKQNYRMFMSNSQDESSVELEAIASLKEHACDAVVLHSKVTDENTLIQLAQSIPGFVLINRFIPAIANRCVWLDSYAGSKQLTQYLIEKGHRKFAIATSALDEEDAHDRVKATLDTLHQHGISVDKKNIVASITGMAEGEEIAHQLIKKGVDFTALVCHNDLQAIGAMNVFLDAGIQVPDDLSIVGFDDLYVSRACRPKLTTMNYPVEEMASYAVELAISLSKGEGQDSNRTHQFLPTFVERQSVADLS